MFNFNKRMSDSRKVIIGALAQSDQTWKQLLVLYYGEERAKSASKRSFNTQLKNLKEGLNLIEKTNQGLYTLTDFGRKVFEENKAEFENVVSSARKLHEQKDDQEVN